MRTITLEEHFTTPKFLEGPGRKRKEHAEKAGGRLAKVFAQLADVGPGRLAEMDAAGIDMQVLSLTSPGAEQSDAAEAIALATEANDFLADRGEAASDALRRARRAADHGAGQGGGRTGAARAPAEIRRRGDPRPQPRPLSRQQVLLADPGSRRKAQCADLSASDAAAARRHRHLLRRLRAGGDRHVRRVGLGLAHRNRGAHRAPRARRRVRSVSEIAVRHRPSRRGAAVHAAAARHHGACGDQAETAGQLLSAQQRALHHFRLQFPGRVFSISSSKSASTASCSRPTIPTPR